MGNCLRLDDLGRWRHLLSNREGELLRRLSEILISRNGLVVLLMDSILLVIHLVRVLFSLLIIGPSLVSPLTIILLSTSIVTIVLVTISSSSLVLGARVAITTVLVVVGPLSSTAKALVATNSVVTQI